MPVYLVFLHVAKKNLQFALCGPNLFAQLEACKRDLTAKKFFLKLCFLLSKYLPKDSCSKIFMYGEDCQTNKVWVKTGNAC